MKDPSDSSVDATTLSKFEWRPEDVVMLESDEPGDDDEDE
jgi:hypothetical protein